MLSILDFAISIWMSRYYLTERTLTCIAQEEAERLQNARIAFDDMKTLRRTNGVAVCLRQNSHPQ